MENLEKQKFDTLKLLADANVKISDAKATLEQLEATKTDYLKLREEKTKEDIQKILNDSKGLVEEIHKNYKSVQVLCSVVSSYTVFLSEMQDKFSNMFSDFEKRNELWEKNVAAQKKELSEYQRIVKQDAEDIQSKEKILNETAERLKREKALIESRQQALQTSYNAEKELWNQLQKKN